MIIARNIDSFMTPFLRMLYDGVQLTFNTMQSIEFGGTNMLQVMATIMILGIALPIIITLAQNSTKIDYNYYSPKHDLNAGTRREQAYGMTRESWREAKKRGIVKY